MKVTRFTIFVLQFGGYLWHLCLYGVVVPALVYHLSLGLDYFIFGVLTEYQSGQIFAVLPENWRLVLALILIALGVLIIVESAITLIEKARAFPFSLVPHYHLNPETLAKSGWYAKIRHPMLLGYLIILLGIGIWVQSISFIFWWVPMVGLVALEYQLMIEEPRLLSWFGEKYEEYRKSTPALIPRLRLGV